MAPATVTVTDAASRRISLDKVLSHMSKYRRKSTSKVAVESQATVQKVKISPDHAQIQPAIKKIKKVIPDTQIDHSWVLPIHHRCAAEADVDACGSLDKIISHMRRYHRQQVQPAREKELVVAAASCRPPMPAGTMRRVQTAPARCRNIMPAAGTEKTNALDKIIAHMQRFHRQQEQPARRTRELAAAASPKAASTKVAAETTTTTTTTTEVPPLGPSSLPAKTIDDEQLNALRVQRERLYEDGETPSPSTPATTTRPAPPPPMLREPARLASATRRAPPPPMLRLPFRLASAPGRIACPA